jgi:transposase InsO family protein
MADEQLRVKTRTIFEQGRKAYGSPRIHAELRAKGDRHSRKRIARIMREEGLCAGRKRKFKATTDSRHGFPIAPNVLERDFRMAEPNRGWCGDVTAIWTNCGWRFLSALIDLFSRRIVE